MDAATHTLAVLAHDAADPATLGLDPIKQRTVEIVVINAPQPRSPARSEVIRQKTGHSVTAMLPEVPPPVQAETAEVDWVLSHPDDPFAREIARLARRIVGKTVGVALGAGAGRGHAHIGVLRALSRM